MTPLLPIPIPSLAHVTPVTNRVTIRVPFVSYFVVCSPSHSHCPRKKVARCPFGHRALVLPVTYYGLSHRTKRERGSLSVDVG